MLLLDVLEVVIVKYDFLYLFLWQKAWEEIVRVGLTHAFFIFIETAGPIIVTEDFCVSLHFLLQHQKVHHLVEHRHCRLRATSHLSRRLPRIDLERLDTLAKASDLLVDVDQVVLEGPLENLQGGLLLQLALLQSI